MKRYLLLSIVAAAAMSIASASRGATVPYARIFFNQTGFDIPANKIIVIDQVECSSNFVQIVIKYNNTGIDGSSGTFTYVATNTTRNAAFALPAPLRLQSGWSVSNVTGTAVYILGIAMDSSDFYGSINSQFDAISVNGPLVTTHAQLDKPWPAITRLEQSSDMSSWGQVPVYAATHENTTSLVVQTLSLTEGTSYRLKNRLRR